MFKYVLKRVLIGFVTLFVLGSATFFLMKATPGSPVSGERFRSKEAQELAIIRYGLDKPVFEQYTMYLNNLAHGDLGESYIKEGVYVDRTIAQTFPVTARLGGIAFIFALVVGITLGTTAALSKRRWVNNVCMFIATIGVSVPSFLLGMFLIIIFGVELRVLPFVGLTSPAHYVLPVLSLALYPAGVISRLMGNALAEEMGKQYVLGADLPSEWEGHLKETIKQMQSYQNYSSRYLLIVDNSTGNSTESEYSGTFPKSSTKAQRIIASAPLNKSINELVAWVKQQIENI